MVQAEGDGMVGRVEDPDQMALMEVGRGQLRGAQHGPPGEASQHLIVWIKRRGSHTGDRPGPWLLHY